MSQVEIEYPPNDNMTSDGTVSTPTTDTILTHRLFQYKGDISPFPILIDASAFSLTRSS